ncbi:MAG: cation:proton antiporter, partial [Proteobacteria bacterium]|nr:cation:proton antiporter [Pseudomonadota bacterium]
MHLPLLIVDLAYILGIAACVTLLFKRLKQPAVLGYIIAGLIVGPYLPGPIVGDTKGIQVWAELGVIFIMFSLGLEFSFRKLVKIGFPAVISGVIQISTMLILGYYSGLLLGWSSKASLFLAGMVSISSTMIIVKVFEELKLRGRKFTDMVFGILIIEDLAAILILVSLSTFGHQTEWDGIAL